MNWCRRLAGLWIHEASKSIRLRRPLSHEEGKHYLQRFWEKLPDPGQIVVFDRSWYGRVLVEKRVLIRPRQASVRCCWCFASGSVCTRMKSSIAPAIMSELFRPADGAWGIGAWYNLTVALFGGTAPLVIQWLSKIADSSWFFWYVSVGAAVAFVATLTLPETKGSVLR